MLMNHTVGIIAQKFIRRLAVAALFAVPLLPLRHATAFVLGDAANYAVIFQGGGNNDLNINNGPGINHIAVNGDIGIDNTPPNNGSLQLTGPLTLNSDVHFAGVVNDNGPYSGNIVVNGTISGGHTNVHTDMVTLNALSSTLGAEAGTSVALNTGATINAASGTFDGSGNSVFTVSGISAPNGTLTINGDGVHDVVFNVDAAHDGNFHFNRIVLGGGLTSDHVLFNFFGGNPITLSGGPTLDINSNFSSNSNFQLYGVFLDPYGTVSINDSVLNGRIFGGDSHNEQIVSGAEINAPTVPDAGATLLLMGLGLAFLVGAKKKFGS
jgi:hypothetical protein